MRWDRIAVDAIGLFGFALFIFGIYSEFGLNAAAMVSGGMLIGFAYRAAR